MEQLSSNFEPQTPPALQEERPMGKPIPTFLFALVCLLMGVLFCELLPIERYPLGYALYAALLFGVTLLFGYLQGARPRAGAYLAMTLGLVVASYYLLNGWNGYDVMELYPVFLADAVCYLYFVLALFCETRGKSFFLDLVRAVFVYPFLNFHNLFTTLFTRKNRGKGFGKTLLFCLIGLVGGLILVAVVASILSYDAHFAALLPDLSCDDAWLHVCRILLAIPIAALLFGAFLSSLQNRLPQFSKAETAAQVSERVRILPLYVFLIPIVGLLAVYTLFFASQWSYYMSAFSHVLPADYSAAEYAREGFFQLCVVSVLNAAVLCAMRIFSKKGNAALTTLTRIAAILLSLFTLVLIATAFSKILLYIERFDLTLTRVYVTIILGVLTVGFLTMVLALLFRRVKVFPVMAAVVALLLLVTPFVRIKARVAAYNVDAYIESQQTERVPRQIDVKYFPKLGRDAVPQAVRLYQSGTLSAANKERLLDYFSDMQNELNRRAKDGVFAYSVTDWQARQALSQIADDIAANNTI